MKFHIFSGLSHVDNGHIYVLHTKADAGTICLSDGLTRMLSVGGAVVSAGAHVLD